MFDPNIDNINRIVNSASEEIAFLLKSSTHSKRLIILASLLEGRKSFTELKKATGLSKTALANHLSQMLKSFLISRIDRGFYELSEDGRELLVKIVTMYHRSELYQTSQRELLKTQYMRFRRFGDIMTKTKKLVSNVGIYQPHGAWFNSPICFFYFFIYLFDIFCLMI
ncbi:MAG: winged helix-turn-helix domain-containing protein [Candidatus Heimdallarchaeaceae archaeon]